MKIQKTVALWFFSMTMISCQHTQRLVDVATEHTDFEQGMGDQQLPKGWQARLNDGYQLSMDAGQQIHSQALKMDGTKGAKAVMLFQKEILEQPVNARFVLTGHLATEHLKGEAALYFRAYSDGQLIHQDDMRAYALSGNRAWSKVSIRSPLLQSVTTVEFGVLSLGEGITWVDDISLQQNLNEGISSEAKIYARTAVELIESNSIYPLDQTTKQKFYSSLKGAQEVADVHGSLVQILHEMGDQHASFIPAEVLNNSSSKDMDTAVLRQPMNDVPRSDHHLTDIGYIMIPGFDKATGDAPAYVAAAQKVFMNGYSGARCGWIIDLRGNTGGSMWPMLAAVAPLLNEEVVGYMLDSRDGELPWRVTKHDVLLGDLVKQPLGYDLFALKQKLSADNSSQQIVILMDNNTASSAEAVAMAFKGQDGVTYLGDKSSGLTTGISQVELPDGSLIRLSIAHFADRNQQIHLQGLVPDVDLDENRPLIDQARHFLNSKDSCKHKER